MLARILLLVPVLNAPERQGMKWRKHLTFPCSYYSNLTFHPSSWKLCFYTKVTMHPRCYHGNHGDTLGCNFKGCWTSTPILTVCLSLVLPYKYHVCTLLIMLFIPNATVDHLLQLLVSQLVWCKQDVLDQRPPHNTAHKAHLVSLDSPLNVAPCPTKFTTHTRQKWSSSFDRAWWLLQLHHTEIKSAEM